jgi:acetyl esterase/lipase
MQGMLVLEDLVYARIGDRELALDLYLPDHAPSSVPLVVWVHGGAWRTGSKADSPVARLVGRGYAAASVGYRLSQEATFPAQIHDCKAAVRWLRARARRYGLNPERVGAWGASAGGHLVALLGTSERIEALEGEEGVLGYSSAVQAVCDFFGPTDFLHMDDLRGENPHDAPDSPESQLLGGPIREHPDRVAFANPITYVRAGVPPFLIVHGDQDRTVLPNQSEMLHRALLEVGGEVTYHVVHGAGHGFGSAPAAQRAEIDALVDAFFDRHLKGVRP